MSSSVFRRNPHKFRSSPATRWGKPCVLLALLSSLAALCTQVSAHPAALRPRFRSQRLIGLKASLPLFRQQVVQSVSRLGLTLDGCSSTSDCTPPRTCNGLSEGPVGQCLDLLTDCKSNDKCDCGESCAKLDALNEYGVCYSNKHIEGNNNLTVVDGPSACKDPSANCDNENTGGNGTECGGNGGSGSPGKGGGGGNAGKGGGGGNPGKGCDAAEMTPVATTPPRATPPPDDNGGNVSGGNGSGGGNNNGGEETPPGDTPEMTPVATTPPRATPPPEPTEDPEDTDEGVCFPGSARVHLADGTTTKMSSLQAGQAVAHDEHASSSPVFLFTHRAPMKRAWFRQLTTDGGHTLVLTASHYLYASGRLTSAASVVVGDKLRTVDGEKRVIDVRRVQRMGLFAPHSTHGDLVVDGIVVSGYSRAVAPALAHAVLAPVRWAVSRFGWVEPLGTALYDGGRGWEQLLPGGKSRY